MAEAGGGVAKAVNQWVQTLAILAAGLWGVYTFIYLEITKPASAPINLSTEIVIRKAGIGAQAAADGGRLIAVNLNITATNPSTRTVYILPNYWRAMGYRVQARPDSVEWRAEANASIQTRMPVGAAEHYIMNSGALVGFASVIPDDELKPGEAVSRSYVFYVPEGAYDLIDVEAVLPTASQAGAVSTEWSVRPDGYVDLKVYDTAEGQRVEAPRRKDGTYVDAELNLQTAQSRQQLSLWEETPAP